MHAGQSISKRLKNQSIKECCAAPFGFVLNAALVEMGTGDDNIDLSTSQLRKDKQILMD